MLLFFCFFFNDRKFSRKPASATEVRIMIALFICGVCVWKDERAGRGNKKM